MLSPLNRISQTQQLEEAGEVSIHVVEIEKTAGSVRA